MATDMTEAKALMFNRDYIDIYSNSWGPDDRGFLGRKKRGSIFVFAAGNGGILAKDSCAYNGYVNSIYTIAISSVNRDGSVPYY
ncbi:unnamed protein product [Porites evermanni]|uniref:Peptidase S8/S53 domain-containing protein n=1 Tax=Porites evermanni TaxID=104178 RepID=A0ABN8SR62_9CNID|nr:unnamed protein product [Porites evermanni]